MTNLYNLTATDRVLRLDLAWNAVLTIDLDEGKVVFIANKVDNSYNNPNRFPTSERVDLRLQLTQQQLNELHKFAPAAPKAPTPGDWLQVVYPDNDLRFDVVVDESGWFPGKADIESGNAYIDYSIEAGWKFYHDNDDPYDRYWFAQSPNKVWYFYLGNRRWFRNDEDSPAPSADCLTESSYNEFKTTAENNGFNSSHPRDVS